MVHVIESIYILSLFENKTFKELYYLLFLRILNYRPLQFYYALWHLNIKIKRFNQGKSLADEGHKTFKASIATQKYVIQFLSTNVY